MMVLVLTSCSWFLLLFYVRFGKIWIWIMIYCCGVPSVPVLSSRARCRIAMRSWEICFEWAEGTWSFVIYGLREWFYSRGWGGFRRWRGGCLLSFPWVLRWGLVYLLIFIQFWWVGRDGRCFVSADCWCYLFSLPCMVNVPRIIWWVFLLFLYYFLFAYMLTWWLVRLSWRAGWLWYFFHWVSG